MSLLNDTLRNLEQRNAAGQSSPPGVVGYHGLMGGSKSKASQKWRVLLIACPLVIGATFLGYRYWMLSQASLPVMASYSVPHSETVTPVVALPAMSTDRTVEREVSIAPDEVPAQVQKTEPAVNNIEPPVNSDSHVDGSVPAVVQLSVVEPAPAPVTPKRTEEITPMATVTAIESRSAKDSTSKPKATQVKEVLAETPIEPAEVSPLDTTPVVSAKLAKTQRLSAEELDASAAAHARKLLAEGAAVDAEDLLKRQLAVNPGAMQSRTLLATHLFESNRVNELNLLLAPQYLSLSPMLRMLEARLLLAKGRGAAALAVMESSVPELEGYTDYHALLAALYQQEQRASEAVNEYALLLREHPHVADWWAGMAIALDRSGHYEGAKKAYERALQTQGLHDDLARYARDRVNQLGRAG